MSKAVAPLVSLAARRVRPTDGGNPSSLLSCEPLRVIPPVCRLSHGETEAALTFAAAEATLKR